ncbi:MAG: hypothetical protein LDL56_04375, partial [Armatimonadetes bacterium]|nr:hypothetical protein [Armatimonadota bacterium]
MRSQIEIQLTTKGVAAVQNSLNQVLGTVKSWAGRLAGAFGLAFSFQAVAHAAAGAVKAAQENATATAQLAAVAGQATAALQAKADALQRLTGFEDEEVMAAQRALFAYGATAEQVRRLTPLAADLAAMLGVDLVGAVKLLRGALDGQKIALGRLNIEAQSFDELVEVLTARVRGQAEAAFRAKGAAAEL